MIEIKKHSYKAINDGNDTENVPVSQNLHKLYQQHVKTLHNYLRKK